MLRVQCLTQNKQVFLLKLRVILPNCVYCHANSKINTKKVPKQNQFDSNQENAHQQEGENMKPVSTAKLISTTSALAVLLLASGSVVAQQSTPQSAAQPAPPKADEATTTSKVDAVVVTGTRIKAAGLTSTSPVSQITAEELALARAVTVEDFSVKLPQLAGDFRFWSTRPGRDNFRT